MVLPDAVGETAADQRASQYSDSDHEDKDADDSARRRVVLGHENYRESPQMVWPIPTSGPASAIS
jgi:hypothetical protein